MYYNVRAVRHLMYIYLHFWILRPPVVKPRRKAGYGKEEKQTTDLRLECLLGRIKKYLSKDI